MINLRYHVVSLVAVFLALGMGIVMGSTVIDRVTVDALNNNLNSVRNDINRTREENSRLAEQVREGQEFADQSLTHVLRDQLSGVPVLVVAVTGVDRRPVESLRQSLLASGASLQGTIWVNSKMRLDNEGETRALAAALASATPGATTTTPADAPASTSTTVFGAAAAEVRRQALARLVAEPGPLAAMVSAGFLGYEPPPEAASPSATDAAGAAPAPAPGMGVIPVAGTRFVVVSGAGAEVGDDLLAIPLAQVLATGGGPAVAAEAGQDTDGGRGVFVGLLRSDATANGKVSTVDNLESPMGQAAVILALAELGESRVGHFGVGPGAQRLLPALPA
ncbi:MAG TPA: copper transporter [Acidimicrobiales bacterium]|nr:copper transporter [Acidimicrobiales bacterium]